MLKRDKKEGKCIYIMPARPYTYIIEKKKGFCKPFLLLYNDNLNHRLNACFDCVLDSDCF